MWTFGAAQGLTYFVHDAFVGPWRKLQIKLRVTVVIGWFVSIVWIGFNDRHFLYAERVHLIPLLPLGLSLMDWKKSCDFFVVTEFPEGKSYGLWEDSSWGFSGAHLLSLLYSTKHWLSMLRGNGSLLIGIRFVEGRRVSLSEWIDCGLETSNRKWDCNEQIIPTRMIWFKLTLSFFDWLSFSLRRKFFFALSTFCSSFRWSPLIFDNFLLCSFKWWDFLCCSIGTWDVTDDVWMELIDEGLLNTKSSILSQLDGTFGDPMPTFKMSSLELLSIFLLL
jgi:hypothetical protein